MNLSQVQGELEHIPQDDMQPRLQAEEARLLRIIEAIRGINESKEWSTLKTEVFDNLANVLEKDLKTAARVDNPDLNKITRIAGELKWAERFANLDKFENSYRVQLQAVRIKLHGNKSE